MSNRHTGNMQPEMDREEHARISNTDGKKVFVIDHEDNQITDFIGANKISTTSFNSRDSATLAADATFQGNGEDVSAYGRVGVSITSTTATATGTVTMEVSHDNVTWGGPTRTWKTYNAPLMWNIVEKYFRVKYVNDSVEAANFSIQTQYSNNADIVLGHQLNEILPAGTESQAVRPTNSFDLDSARKHIVGQRAFFFFGENNALGSGTWADVTTAESNFHWATTAAKIKVKSTHGDDNGVTPGAGLRSVEIHGLDAEGNANEEILLLNGVTPVESANSYIRVTHMHNEVAGTYGGSHRGDIEFRVTNATFGSGALMGIMKGFEGAADGSVQYGFGEAQLGFTSIPLGKVAYITRLEVIPNSAKPIDIALYEREDILDVSGDMSPRRVLWSADEIIAPVEKVFKSHIKIKALADIWFRAEGNGQASGVAVSLDYYLVDSNALGA